MLKPAVEQAQLNRREMLTGSTALLLASCGGGGGSSSPAPIAEAPDAPPPAPPPAEVFGPEVATIGAFYRPEDGNNLQPAFQAAIDFAAANGKRKVVNDKGAVRAEMWCPRRISPFADEHGLPGLYESDGVPLVVRDPVHLDFRAASFDLRGPGGGAREQRDVQYRLPYLGGWLYVIGRPGFDRITVENVTVDGHFPGPFITADDSNPSDKGFRLMNPGVQVDVVELRNVELRNFGCEIYYAAGNGPRLQHFENCHFHGSPQSAFNPGAGSGGKLVAINLQAGRSYQVIESMGAGGQRYVNCRFYEAGNGGANFLGGPSPHILYRHPFWFAHWDGVGEPPWVDFENTRLEDCHFVNLGAWMRGKLITRDTAVAPLFRVGHCRDIHLEIESWCDRRTDLYALLLNGPPDSATPFKEMPYEYYFKPPSDMSFKILCRRTNNAIKAGIRHRAGVGYYGGLIDARTISATVGGEAAELARMLGTPAAGFAYPNVASGGLITTG